MSHYHDLDLLTTEELLALPPATWLMDQLIPEEGFVGLYGPPSSGKSFVALDWAMCISEGKPWLDRYPTKQAPVVYVAAEGGRGIQQRVRAWMLHHGYARLPAIYFLLNPLYVREEGTVEAFLDDLDDKDIWPGLLVLDTLSRSFGGGEENASADMGEFVDQMTKLAQGRRMAALVVHHTNAQGARERGNTAFRGAADAMFSCVSKRNGDNRIIQVELGNNKQKDSQEVPPIYLAPVAECDTLPSLVLEWVDAPEPTRKGEGGKEPTPMRKKDMLAVLGAAEDGLTFTEWRLAAGGIPKRTFARRVRQLMSDGEVEKQDFKYVVPVAGLDIAELEGPEDPLDR